MDTFRKIPPNFFKIFQRLFQFLTQSGFVCLWFLRGASPSSNWIFTTHVDNSKLTGPYSVERLPGGRASCFYPNLPPYKSQNS